MREYAEASAAANYRPGAQRDGQANVYEKQMHENPREIGWRPFDKFEALLGLLADPDVEMHKVPSNRIVDAIQTSALARAQRTPTGISLVDPQPVNGEQLPGPATDPPMSGTKLDAGLPTAEDLDAVAAEQKAKEATDAEKRAADSGAGGTFLDEGQTHIPAAGEETGTVVEYLEPEPEAEAVAEDFLDTVGSGSAVDAVRDPAPEGMTDASDGEPAAEADQAAAEMESEGAPAQGSTEGQ